MLIFLIPGMIGWALHQKGIIQMPASVVGGVPIDGDQVFATLVKALLPAGIRGLIVACLLAALMSSLASLFNSSASLFTVDIYEKLRPGKSPKHLLMVGRIATAVVVFLGIIWIPVMAKVAGRWPLPVPAERAGLPGAADHGRLPPRPVLEADQLQRAPPGAWAAASSWA